MVLKLPRNRSPIKVDSALRFTDTNWRGESPVLVVFYDDESGESRLLAIVVAGREERIGSNLSFKISSTNGDQVPAA